MYPIVKTETFEDHFSELDDTADKTADKTNSLDNTYDKEDFDIKDEFKY